MGSDSDLLRQARPAKCSLEPSKKQARRVTRNSANGGFQARVRQVAYLVFYARSKKMKKKTENGKEKIPTLGKMLTMPSTISVCMSSGRKSKFNS